MCRIGMSHGETTDQQNQGSQSLRGSCIFRRTIVDETCSLPHNGLMAGRRKKHKRRSGARGALIKGMTKSLPSEILGDPVFEEKLTELLRGHSGIYVLYKDDSVYYVGLARSLH